MAQQQTITDDSPAPEQYLDEQIAASVLEADEGYVAAQEWESLPEDGPETETAAPVESESSDGTEDAGPTETSTEATAAEAAPEPSAELATAQAEITRLNTEAETRKTEADTVRLDSDVRSYAGQYAQQLVESGQYTEEQAKAKAEDQRRLWMAEHQLGAERQQNLARELSVAHGVPVAELLVANTREEMHLIATAVKPDSPEMTALKKENVELKKAAVPVQPNLQQANRTATTNEQGLQDQYIAGVRTPETIAAGRRMANGQ